MQYLLCKCRQKGQKEMASVMFTVPGKPQGKARARTYYNASTKKHCSTTPENTVLYENFIKDRYLQMAKGAFLERETKIESNNVEIHVYTFSTCITNKKTVTVSGKTDDVSSKPVTVTVNGATVTVGTDGTFTKDVTLAEGANTITIVAKDKAGKTTTVTRKVTVDTSAPVIKSVTLTPNPVDCGKTFIIAVEITD